MRSAAEGATATARTDQSHAKQDRPNRRRPPEKAPNRKSPGFLFDSGVVHAPPSRQPRPRFALKAVTVLPRTADRTVNPVRAS